MNNCKPLLAALSGIFLAGFVLTLLAVVAGKNGASDSNKTLLYAALMVGGCLGFGAWSGLLMLELRAFPATAEKLRRALVLAGFFAGQLLAYAVCAYVFIR